MARLSIFLTICICICVFISLVSPQDQERKVYIAYMGYLLEGDYSPSLHHSEIIKQIVHPSFAAQSLIRSYERSFNGFAAHLSEEEKDKLTRIAGVISVFPCQKSQLQTTRSWDFMGFSRSIERRPVVESDIIIGVIDSGIWPESESFNDEGFGPIPAKWKGVCDGGKDFVCNRKIIGARTYIVESSGELSARDTIGHGTHVTSILAGNEVRHASYYGMAHGIARGGVPSARVSVYKVCDQACAHTDILSAFDNAIADGVEIISISIAPPYSQELTFDPIAIGAFHAIEKGILTVNAAGNDGPFLSSIKSYAPWVLTVAASDIDRKIIDKLHLGKDTILVGNAINAFPSSASELPLVYGKEVTNSCSEIDARNCFDQCLDSSLVGQKVVLCDQMPSNMYLDVNISGAHGYIYPSSSNLSLLTLCPTIALSINDLNLVKIFKNSTIKPGVQILRSETIDNLDAPSIGLFSSRGPSRFLPDIIKPDVTAPGVEIIAAFSPIGLPSVKFSILSGTSMACPHVAAAAAFVKSFHPEWSPSAIKSALMTTAWEFNASLYPEAEFAYGSGHIDPIKATDPGLVFETSVQEYLKIWCNIPRTLGSLIPINASCPMTLSPKEINYPSMVVQVEARVPFVVSFPRTVTNVGPANSTYVASIKGETSNLHLNVEPDTLQFTATDQEMNFVVNVRGDKMNPLTTKSVSLVWTDGVHRVRSPLAIHTASGGENALTPSSPIVIDTTSDGEIASTLSRLHILMLILLITTMY